MTDDAELRARIEAQVAARRAGASKSGDVDDEELAPEAAPPSRRPHGPQSLTPARPWSRTDAPADETDASETDSSVNAGATSARPGVGPTRPWAVRQQAESPAPVEETAEPVTSDGRLQPLRPWSAGAEPVVPTANGPAPSHPDLVLRGITDSSPETEQEPANRLRGLRSLGRRRPDDDAAPVESDDAQVERVTRDRGELEEAFAAQRAEGERLAAERAARQEQEGERAAAERKATEEITASGAAVYVPDAEAVTAYAEAAAPMLDLPAADQEADGSSAQGRRGRRRRGRTVETPAVAIVPTLPEDANAAVPDALDEPPAAVLEPSKAAEVSRTVPDYPWQRSSEVDLDLKGAPTWDPSDYPDEEPEKGRRGRRAMRWLLARSPESASDDAPAETQLLDAALTDDHAQAASAPDLTAAADEPPPLPRPTRRWSRSAPPVEPAPAEPPPVEPAPAEPQAVEPAPAEPPAAEPPAIASVPPESQQESQPEPQPEPAPQPDPEPEVRPRPSARRRPTPGVDPASTRPRRRPSPGPRHAAPRRQMPFERSGRGGGSSSAPPTSLVKAPSPTSVPDLSRFLRVSEAGDDDETDGEKDERGGKRGGSGRRRRFLIGTFALVVIVAAAALVLRVFVVQPYYIPSASMEPTLHGCPGCDDDHILVDKVSYRIHGVRAGDIVVFHRPKNAPTSIESVLVKRVIALGGDTVALKKGRVYVNGLVIEESYINKNHSCYATSPDENFAARTVPKGDVFVMGDNRCDSTDSRDFGPVPTSSIIGRAFAIIWPFKRRGFL